MINKKKIVELTETARTLVEGNGLPEPSWRSPFAKYASALNEVLSANDLGSGWDFDPDSRCFYREVMGHAAVAGYRGGFTITLTLDPSEPLAKEIPRLQGELETFKLRCQMSVHNPWAPVFSGLSMEEMQCLVAGLQALYSGKNSDRRWGKVSRDLQARLGIDEVKS